MLISLNVAGERLTTAHRAKLAYVYVRQSSVNQVRQPGELAADWTRLENEEPIEA
ncbi:hypothetical protein ACVWZM_004571 [Bradyrhizobium sp. USDA 4501]